jgi:hypothetical protein
MEYRAPMHCAHAESWAPAQRSMFRLRVVSIIMWDVFVLKQYRCTFLLITK